MYVDSTHFDCCSLLTLKCPDHLQLHVIVVTHFSAVLHQLTQHVHYTYIRSENLNHTPLQLLPLGCAVEYSTTGFLLRVIQSVVAAIVCRSCSDRKLCISGSSCCTHTKCHSMHGSGALSVGHGTA